MKALIINADDMGVSPFINSEIIRLYKASAITGTSINACGPAFTEACRLLRDNGINEAGAHLTLTENYPPVNPGTYKIKGFLSKKGHFPSGYINLALKLYFGKIKRQALKDELRLQVENIRNEGFVITHMDSHEHVHMLSDVWKIALELCREFTIPFIRIPFESLTVFKIDFTLKDMARSTALRFFSKKAYRALQGFQVCSSDAFLGHFHSGRITGDTLSFMADNIPEAITELVVHPAAYSQELLRENPFYKNGPIETKALMSGQWREKLSTLGINLISHADACVIARSKNPRHCERSPEPNL